MKSLIGMTFNFLTVIDGPARKNNKIYWVCQCQCGNVKEIRADLLQSGTTKSCGCYKKNILITENKKRQPIDLTQQHFGKLLALEPTDQRNNDGRVIWKCQCDCGTICYVDSHTLKEGKRISCGCIISKGEVLISKLLQQHNIDFIKQASFNSCRFPNNNYLAKFDFYIENKYLIEFDGEQHFCYKDNPHTWNTKENYEKVKEHDDFKNQWCKENNIPLIRIPYTHLNDLCFDDLRLETSKFII